ncbi:hypothetical protein Tco_1517574 [Tanacetum coccineum]
MPLFPSPEPSVSCIDDLDFFKDFENEFPAIVYNDALMSKSDFSTEPTLCPQHIDEFDLKDETSLSEYDEVEQNVLYFMPQILMRVLKLFQHPYMCPHHQLQVGLCPRDWGDLRRRYKGYVRILGVCKDLHSMRPFEGVTLRSSRGVSDAGPTPGSKFSTIVHEYVTEPSMLSKSRAELRRESVYKSVEAEEKSNLKTLL